MQINDFGVEKWMNDHENDCIYNLSETCVDSLTVRELLDISGNKDGVIHDIENMKLAYGAIPGSERLRNAICGLYDSVTPSNIAICHGGIGANSLALMTLVEPGDKVVSVLPTYQQNYSLPEAFGADVTILELDEKNAWLPDLNDLRKAVCADTKVICLNNPNNPTGSNMDEAFLKEVIYIADSCSAYLFCDEVYRGLNHHGNPFTSSVTDLYDRGVSTSSMSKTFSLAGLRIGWIAAPESFIDQVSRHRDYHVISVGMISDYLASLALENKEKILERNLNICRKNAQLLSEWVSNEPHISYIKPESGTTAFLKYDIDIPSVDLCLKLQKETGVLLVPGSVMGIEGYLRIGYGNNNELIKNGLSSFSEWLKRF